MLLFSISSPLVLHTIFLVKVYGIPQNEDTSLPRDIDSNLVFHNKVDER